VIARATQWAYPNARLRHYLGELARRSYYEELAQLSLSDSLNFLEENPPSGVEHAQITDSNKELGARIFRAYEKHLLRLSSMVDDKSRSYLRLELEHVIVDDLKHLIRRIASGHTGDGNEPADFIALGHTELTTDFTEATSLETLGEALSGTVFDDPYGIALASYREQSDILGFEVALDLDYHQRLKRAIDTLDKDDALAVGKLFRRKCDIRNLGWILRFRFNYELTPVEIFNYTVSYGYELNDDRVMALARIGLPEHALRILEDLQIGRFIASTLAAMECTTPNVIDFEIALSNYWEHIHRQTLCGSPFGLLPFVAYQALKELEMTRLRRVLMGHELDLEPEEILESLYLARGGSSD